MNIGFIVAMPEEFRAVVKALDATTSMKIGKYKGGSGKISGHNVVALESGMGFDNAARGTQALLGFMRPDILISAGFCGGIEPDLSVGTIVMATRLAIVSGKCFDEIPVEIAAACFNFIARRSLSSDPISGGLFVSTPVITEKAKIASLLPAGASNPVLEMESSSIALIAAENNIPFVGIRSVSDPADEELGFSLDEFCDRQMRIRIPLLLFTVMRKPLIIPQLLRLARNSRTAAATLSQATGDFLRFI